ncbi:MAG: helicase, partial [Methylotenera sp.]
ANIGQIEAISNQLYTAKISECLEYFANRLQFNHTLFALSKIGAQLNQALLVDEFALKLALKDKFIFTCAPISINVNIEKDYFLLCLKSVVEHAIRTLPPAPNWLNSNNPKHLEQAEILSQNISLYAWLSFKFPQIFVDVESIPHFRKSVSRYIERALLTQAGYIDTQRECDLLKFKNGFR